jgi:2',3'-cyclic-nucleotide 2'-phosphodiesterase (5'-nucleotidase family)
VTRVFRSVALKKWGRLQPAPGLSPAVGAHHTVRNRWAEDRHRLKPTLLFTLLLALVGIAAAADTVRELTILHTNDIHARLTPTERGQGGFAQLAAAIRHEREDCTGCLLLNAGDLVQGTPVSTIFHGEPVYQIANLFGFDAATLGNHEFDYGWATTKKFLAIARYPIVCANVVDADGRLMTSKPYVILKANGVRVAVIGALMDLTAMTTPNTRGPWRALPVVETVRRYAREVRGKSDLVVLLAHITTEDEKNVLQSVPEVSISITGHSHIGMHAPLKLDGRGVVRVKGDSEELGRLDLRVDVGRKKLVSWDWKQIPISGTGPVAKDVDREVKRWEAEVTKAVDVPIGESRRHLARADVKLLVERAMAEEMHADFGFVNNGGVRADLPQGPLLARHVWNIMPFDNIVIIAEVKGSDLPAAIVKGRQIEPDRVYTLASTDFTAANQNTFGIHSGPRLTFTTDGPLLRDLLIGWIKRQKVVGENR